MQERRSSRRYDRRQQDARIEPDSLDQTHNNQCSPDVGSSSTSCSSSSSSTSSSSLVMLGGSASLISCIINLTNTVAGTGLLALPHAFAKSGFVVGSFLLVIAALFSANGLRLLTLSAEKVGIRPDRPSSFYVIANAAMPEFTLLIDCAVALKCFGVATGYFITVGGKGSLASEELEESSQFSACGKDARLTLLRSVCHIHDQLFQIAWSMQSNIFCSTFQGRGM